LKCLLSTRTGGKYHEVLAHHNAEEYLHAYIEAAKIGEDKKSPLFRTTEGTSRVLAGNQMTRRDVHRMIKRRALEAGVSALIGCHTFRATGITTYFKNGGTLDHWSLVGYSPLIRGNPSVEQIIKQLRRRRAHSIAPPFPTQS